MSTERRPIVKAAFGLVAGIAVLVPLVVLLVNKAPGNMGAGAAFGGGFVLIAFTIAAWRTARRPDKTTTFERSVTGSADERDRLVATKAAAVLGVASLPITGIATSAVAMGAPATATLGITLYTLLAIAVVSFIVVSRRT
ncbi:hypothetical protein SAMN05216410_3585 [Sanguibacter gelidistatuariae]|uniref:Uncharacterized protein n=1 Tax=Sanguibacter gelidistatuariae TaxID=1814289 RepID=A0A1G6W8B9_9MICO|nr:hypothetical protein [Sanguibacter gelidistatuariae]SDD62190.1 hypothetical protein SAMN05216410_3585 [Sanguibacter gelidistatuariae]